MTNGHLVFFAAILATVMLAQPVSAVVLTSEVDDSAGDVIHHGQPYQDIVRAAVTLRDGRFRFVMDLAATMPDTPTLPPGVVLLDWLWALNTDPATFPVGFPFQPGSGFPAEFHVFVLWDGASFSGIVIDRRPLLTGGEALIIPVSVDIKAARITVSVDAALLANPSSFMWVSRTTNWNTPLGLGGFTDLDDAPDEGWATWPS